MTYARLRGAAAAARHGADQFRPVAFHSAAVNGSRRLLLLLRHR